ncbi:unannotated protein [freshwater metagenome]|uniref:Unannotated protein n=1 Tax=freshwater metagenome TaxID=449393 RepID=A0A6J6I0M3_9ZZZZ
MMPAAAPPHTMDNTMIEVEPAKTNKQNGVYVPAMSTKIIE